MRIWILSLAAVFLGTGLSFAQETSVAPQTPAPTAYAGLKLADATPILLRTKQELSSATAKVGDRVLFRVTQDVKVRDLIVVHRGAEAWGEVTAVQQKARKGRAGSLQVAIKSAQLVNGQSAPLRAEQNVNGVGRSMGTDMGQMLAESRGIGLPFLPLVMLEKGKDAILPENTKSTAYLNGDLLLDQTALERAQPPVVRRTGPATVTIFRTDGWRGYSPDVYCGKITLGWLSAGRFLKIQLPPGKYFLDANAHQVLELSLEEGQDVYIEMQGVVHGLGIRWHFKQVSTEEGEDQVAGYRESNPKNVVKISSVSLTDLRATPDKK